jgi:hypothetical protein
LLEQQKKPKNARKTVREMNAAKINSTPEITKKSKFVERKNSQNPLGLSAERRNLADL